MRYFLLLSKCGTYQAALSAKNGVIGPAADSAAKDAGEGKDFEQVTANAVRLFKYLVPQYYEDFQAFVKRWVHDTLDLLLPNDASHSAAESQPQAAGGQPGDTWKLQTFVQMGGQPQAARERMESERVKFLVTSLLHVDNHPTLTRFFTFRNCVDRMLTMALLKFPQGGLGIKCTAREEGQKRIKKLKRFFAQPAACQALRRDSLVLQLTGGIEAFMSRRPKEGEPPTAVAVQRGEAHVCNAFWTSCTMIRT